MQNKARPSAYSGPGNIDETEKNLTIPVLGAAKAPRPQKTQSPQPVFWQFSGRAMAPGAP
jgi:hypothetical protein